MMPRLLLTLLTLLLLGTACAQPQLDWVTVAHPGNPPDANGLGQVHHTYQIMRHEVTCAHYAAFLNAVAATDDPHGLWHPHHDGAPLPPGRDDIRTEQGGLVRTGQKGAYTYTPVPGRENIPIVHVSFFSALRFANWLHGGRTETGAYDLTTNHPMPRRSPDALYWLPSEDEWHKAAYHDPEAGRYWCYATRSDQRPNSRPPHPTDPNAANFVWIDPADNGANKGYAATLSDVFKPGSLYLLPVGSYPASRSAYGTLDQSGSVWEWTEGIQWETKRVLRGGGWPDEANALRSTTRTSVPPASTYKDTGFRLCRRPPPGSPGP